MGRVNESRLSGYCRQNGGEFTQQPGILFYKAVTVFP